MTRSKVLQLRRSETVEKALQEIWKKYPFLQEEIAETLKMALYHLAASCSASPSDTVTADVTEPDNEEAFIDNDNF
ncbi:MAG: hypothetical protein AAFQ63_15725 [Cyanobacteria bacterium J06621_11]